MIRADYVRRVEKCISRVLWKISRATPPSAQPLAPALIARPLGNQNV